MGRASRYSPEVRDRAVRLVLEHEREHDSQWAAIRSTGGAQGVFRDWLGARRATGGRPPVGGSRSRTGQPHLLPEAVGA